MGKKLYIGNLPYSATDQALVDIFSEVGKIESARVVVDKFTGRSKGFGFIEMSTDQEAEAAVAKFNGADYDGRIIKVAEAKGPEGGGGGGGRGGPGGPRGGGNRFPREGGGHRGPPRGPRGPREGGSGGHHGGG